MKTRYDETGNRIVTCELCEKDFEYFDIITHKCEFGFSRVTREIVSATQTLESAKVRGLIDKEYHDQALDKLIEAYDLVVRGFKEKSK